ncbi:hypothetical protein GCM10020358_68210 [Amorphoplanes nipponensis]|uniref:Uncharacterized protein n=2 Tax=Actinoplanes nipponensis TaxID=135950 RepID=A0A919JIA5_9ACTN|nr:hypothetical protein Ani05nite_50880 [Actinoplanes nipponensis]
MLRKKPGKIPNHAPELRSGLDPLDLYSWELEYEVFERVCRQLRTVGDGLAWRMFGYERNIIFALSRSDPAGPMFDKKGLEREREIIAEAWRDNGEFVLHHDSTSALRIGDLSIFGKDGGVLLREIKTNDRYRDKAQDQKILDTVNALINGGPLAAGGYTLVPSNVAYRANMKGLREILILAHKRGIQGAQLPGRRAIVAVNFSSAPDHFSPHQFNARFAAETKRQQRRAAIRSEHHIIALNSVDRAARSPAEPPWAIYPIEPELAVGLITDVIFYTVCMAPETLLDALAKVGVQGRWLQQLNGTENPAKPLLQVSMRTGNKLSYTSMNVIELARLLIELVDLPTWCQHLSVLLQADLPAGTRPWTYFAGENNVWC